MVSIGDFNSLNLLKMNNNPLPRLDVSRDVHDQLLPLCRLQPGGMWEDAEHGHRVACIDSTNAGQVRELVDGRRAPLAIHDPPYNLVAFQSRRVEDYVAWCRQWVGITNDCLADDASLYVWLGADQKDGFQPLADFMVMMRELPFQTRSFITVRNQRGYGTQNNWMALRQELLYYTKGRPRFNVEAEYTDIPRFSADTTRR